jgi:hypothetical protein
MGEKIKPNSLSDPRKLNLRALAEQLNLPVPAKRVEPPLHEALMLGRLQALAGIEHTDLGDFINRKVKIFNDMAKARGFKETPALTYREYLHRVNHISRSRYETDPFDDVEYTKDFNGYIKYLFDHDPHLETVLATELERPRFILESPDRRKHTLVVGAPGAGKSELMKLMVHHYVKHSELGGVLVIDPHAKMARQIARWREFAGDGADRLVYLDPVRGKSHGGWVPALNPITKGDATDDETSIVAKQLANALVYFGGENEGMTDQMHRLAGFCLNVMLDMEGTTLFDLMEGLNVPSREKSAPKITEPEFVRRGKNHKSRAVRDFFLNDWDGASYRVTRDALKRRLSTYLDVPLFERVVTAQAPLNLEALLNAGKVVVVNCSFAGDAGKALGRFIMAQVESMGKRRLDRGDDAPCPPVHVFVDEATILMSPPFVSILLEFRKVGIWLTMGQQGMGDGGEREFLRKVKNSTHLKFIGRSGNTGEVIRSLGVKMEQPRLGEGKFVVIKNGEERTPMLLEALHPSPVADDTNAMSDAEWAAVLERQFAAYYRKDAAALPAPSATSAPTQAQEKTDNRRGGTRWKR